jgi:hypothetical protein
MQRGEGIRGRREERREERGGGEWWIRGRVDNVLLVVGENGRGR